MKSSQVRPFDEASSQGARNGSDMTNVESPTPDTVTASPQTPEQSKLLISESPNTDNLSIEDTQSESTRKSRKKSKWSELMSTVGSLSTTSRRQSKALLDELFLKRFSMRPPVDYGAQLAELSEVSESSKRTVVHPDDNAMRLWLGLITVVVLYNIWTCIARQAFTQIREGYETVWFITDGASDFIYLLDILIQLRTGYMVRGILVYDSKKLARNYVCSRYFIYDLLSLLPLDLIQLAIGIHPLLRFPRFIKAYRALQFIALVETHTSFPNFWRVAQLTHILFLLIHWFAAFYFMISSVNEFEGTWGYPKPIGEWDDVSRKYFKSLYWSTLTLTTIGDTIPAPDTNLEYMFSTVSYWIGVFVFATVVGNVGNVISNQNARRTEFERLLDAAKSYMAHNDVPKYTQTRVQRWYAYAWSRGIADSSGDIGALSMLPQKIRTEIALHVHLKTLQKVSIFQQCEPDFLQDLVLQMKTLIFTPGDLICRKGEIAREMFIIVDGIVAIIGENGELLTQMSSGDFFGEIGILNLDEGVNKRTTDVRSVGYSELITLSRADVLTALADHPHAEQILKLYGKKRLEEIRKQNMLEGKVEKNDLQRRLSTICDVTPSGTFSQESIVDIEQEQCEDTAIVKDIALVKENKAGTKSSSAATGARCNAAAPLVKSPAAAAKSGSPAIDVKGIKASTDDNSLIQAITDVFQQRMVDFERHYEMRFREQEIANTVAIQKLQKTIDSLQVSLNGHLSACGENVPAKTDS